MGTKTWKSLEGTFTERWNAKSDVKCACGCGGFISNRSKQSKEKGKSQGFLPGHIWKGRKIPKEFTDKMRGPRLSVTGSNNPNYGKGLHGEDNPNWQGGKKLVLYNGSNQRGVNSPKDRIFKRWIKYRDGKCIMCNNTTKLDAHHIEPWVEREDLRFDERNCVTLCKACHCRADNAHHKEEIKPMLEAYIKVKYATI